jgi:protease IV
MADEYKITPPPDEPSETKKDVPPTTATDSGSSPTQPSEAAAPPAFAAQPPNQPQQPQPAYMPEPTQRQPYSAQPQPPYSAQPQPPYSAQPPYAQPPYAYGPQPTGAYTQPPYPPPPPGAYALPPVPPRSSRAWLWGLIGGSAFFLFVLAVFTLIVMSMRGNSNTSSKGLGFGDRIAVVDLEGVIISPDQFVRQLKKYGDDSSIRAIILHVNTPGGGAAASEEMYKEVRRIRDEKKKKIVASIETVGASGGYYVASATDKIYANESSIVGSIGVIAEWVNYGDLMHWAKLKDMTMKAGEFKDTGSPTRDLTPAEREYMQGMLDNMHQQFIKNVADGRKLKYDDVKVIANGKVWTGQQALPLHLIDEVGDFEKCVKDTAKSLGINGEPTLVRSEKEKKSVLDLLFGDASEYLPTRAKMLQTHPGFYYLWR